MCVGSDARFCSIAPGKPAPPAVVRVRVGMRDRVRVRVRVRARVRVRVRGRGRVWGTDGQG